MQRILRAALSGSVFVCLVSCGGSDAPDAAESSKQPQVHAAASAKLATGTTTSTKKARSAKATGRAGKTDIVQFSEPAFAAYAGAISKATLDLSAPAPFTASISSRGPTLAAGGNLLKPDVRRPRRRSAPW